MGRESPVGFDKTDAKIQQAREVPGLLFHKLFNTSAGDPQGFEDMKKENNAVKEGKWNNGKTCCGSMSP